MTDKTDLIREIHEYVTAHGGENTATHLLVQAASVIQTQAAELEAVGAGGVQPLRSVQEGCKLVPLEPTQEMLAALMSPGEAEVLASSPSETFALMLMDRAGIRERYSAMLVAAPQQEAHHLAQALTDQENQPNQYGVEFGMSGQQMHFKIGNQLFRLAYEPDDQQEFEFMKRMLISAFSTFTPDVKTAPQQEAQEPALFVSPKQLAALTDPDDPEGEHGRYLPARKTRKGLFTQPLYAAPQPAPAPLSDDVVKDAARWRWLSEHIGAAWNEGKFTSLVRIVSDKNRAALNASIDRMMTGDWSDAALAAQGGKV